MKTDLELIALFVDERSEAAFSELVSRHLGWVTASARRRLGDSALADDAAQAVFVLLAQKASSLRREVVLSAWLFATLRFVCLAMARDAVRRRRREEEAALMRSENSSGGDSVWGELAGQLDDVVSCLNGTDRRAVLLRYYENKTFLQVGEMLGVSEEAARKRVQRAVAKLASIFRRRGVNVGAESLGGLLVAHLAIAATGGNVGAVTGAALAASSASSAVVKSVGSMIFLAQMKTAALVVAVSGAVLAAGGAAVVVAGGGLGGSAKPLAVAASVAATAPALTAAATLPAASVPNAPTKFAAGLILSPDEKPVAGARVTLVGYDSMGGYFSVEGGTSDVNGRYRLEIPAGKAASNVLIDAPPFAYGQMGVTDDVDETVTLSAAHSAEVTLLLPDGSPAAGVEVAPWQCNGGDRWTGEFWAVEFPEEEKKKLAQRTDAQGKCRFTRMPGDSNMQLDVRDERFARLTYNEGVTIGHGTAAVGKPLKLARASSVAGRVIDLEGKAAVGVIVMAQGRDTGWGATKTDAQGNYSIGRLGAGTFNIVAMPSDRENQTAPPEWTVVAREKVTVAEGAALSGMDFKEERGTLITGKVTLKDTGAAVPDTDVMVYGPARPQSGGMVDSAHTRADGTYTLRVPAGQQHVYVGGPAPDGYTLPDQSTRDVTTAQGKDATVDFMLARAKGKPVSGVVRRADGSPAVGAYVTAQVGGSMNAMPFSGAEARTDEGGKFLFKALTPKSRLRVKMGALATSQPVDVNGGERNLSLVIQKVVPITLHGRVVDAKGKAIAGAEASMEVMFGQFGIGSAPVACDADGNYEIGRLRLGESYSVEAHASGYGRAQAVVHLKSGEQNAQQPPLVLKRADSVVTGTVVDEAGKPLAGVDVNLFGDATRQQRMKTDAHGGFEFADIVEGETLHLALSRDGQYADGGSVEAGTLGAEVVFKKK